MKRIESLTFLRFMAALIVVFFHFGRNTDFAGMVGRIIVSGPDMVSLFFVLSGFVMVVAYLNKENNSWWDYYRARLAKIVPVYLVALFLSVYFFYRSDSDKDGPIGLTLSLFFLQSWVYPYALAINTPAWSLSVEVFFYLTFPVILFVIKKNKVSWIWLLGLSVLVYMFTQIILSGLLYGGYVKTFPSPEHNLIYYFPLSHYCSFLLGISGGYFYMTHRDLFHKSGWASFLILGLAVFVNFFILQFPQALGRFIGFPLAYGSSFCSIFFLLLILSLAYSENFFTRFFSAPFFVLLGEASYSLYILQKPIWSAFSQYAVKLLPEYLRMNTDIKFFIFLFLLIAISIVSHYLIEKPAKKFISNL